jgi:mono/diheme cytochrome c family protein
MRRAILAALLSGALSASTGCKWDWDRMMSQARCDPGAKTKYLPHDRCDQPVPPGAVAWRAPRPVYSPTDAQVRAQMPTRASIERGADRFSRTCAACHGPLGDGLSVVARDMRLRPPPSLLSDAVIGYSDQRLFEVISGGYGMMPAYTYQLTVEDRWAVIHFVRALQHSQHVALDALPPARRQEAAQWLR